MALAKGKKHVKKERQAIYFDLICGAISSILSISGIVFFTITEQIVYLVRFIIGLMFWISYLIFAIALIGFGIYLWYKEKNLEEIQPRKDLKAPIV